MLHQVLRCRPSLLPSLLQQTERVMKKQIVAANFSTLRNSSLNFTSSLVNLQDNKRFYSIGDYDKLWQAVSSGRGKGRGGKKKVKPKDVDGEFLNFGSANMSWPGLNEPIRVHKDPSKVKLKQDFREDRPPRRSYIGTHQRGWCGTTWPGRHAGAPQLANGDINEDFDSIVIEVKKVSTTRASGKRKRTSALVVVGNKKGSIGWAIGKATFAAAAIRKARNKAVNYLHYIPICEGATIYHDFRTKIKSTEVQFERKVPGYGRRCQRIVGAINELAGIENIRCKIIGRTTPLTVVRTTFQGLQMQETHEELAERTGKCVVEYRAEEGNRPVVVAVPSQSAVKRRIDNEDKEEDISKYFDPYRGAHRPKSLSQIQGTNADVLADI